jgi:hypothetical protein
MQVVADDSPLLPELAGHAGVKVAPEEVEAFSAFPEVDQPGLVRVKLETKLTKERGCQLPRSLGLSLRAAQHDEVVGVSDELACAVLSKGPIEGVQEDVGEKGRDDPTLGSARDRL